jgi:hypothetical protein
VARHRVPADVRDHPAHHPWGKGRLLRLDLLLRGLAGRGGRAPAERCRTGRSGTG